jgi:putative ABC transport system ATP-binding protein
VEVTTPGVTPPSLTSAPVNRAAALHTEPAAPAVVRLVDVIKVYREADVETVALRGVDIAIPPGQFVALMGRSGSGKSTLLHLLAGLDRPSAGQVIVDGVDLARADEADRTRIRGSRVGIAFQVQNLVPFLDLEENLLLAAALAGRPLARPSAREILARVGLAERGGHRPEQLSGGEQQRAALAIVAATRPAVLLADEITGELDTATADLVLDLVDELHATGSLTIVLATHDPRVAARADRIVELLDGRVVGDRAIR